MECVPFSTLRNVACVVVSAACQRTRRASTSKAGAEAVIESELELHLCALLHPGNRSARRKSSANCSTVVISLITITG